MKTILVPSDFSEPAANAAHYALSIARQLKANLTLCNAFFVPAEVPTIAHVAWPLYDYSTLKEENTNALKLLAKELQSKDRIPAGPGSFDPLIDCVSETGGVTDVIVKLAKDRKISLAVMGMKGEGALSRFFLGSSSYDMIDRANFPLLLIPAGFIFNGIRKIAFATDLNKGDIEVIHALAGFARYFSAELVITHVSDDKHGDDEPAKRADSFLNDITCKINYDKIYYRHVQNAEVDKGLDWITEHGLIDMLVMVHHHKGFFNRMFGASHTHNKAHHLNIPLLVMPAGSNPVF